MSIDTRALDQMLAELRTASTAASGKPAAQNTPAAGGADFGNSDVNLQDVMVNLQKANLSFQQMVQVRNKLVTAYHDIMNMPV